MTTRFQKLKHEGDGFFNFIVYRTGPDQIAIETATDDIEMSRHVARYLAERLGEECEAAIKVPVKRRKAARSQARKMDKIVDGILATRAGKGE